MDDRTLTTLIQHAHVWQRHDPDERTRAELVDLIDAARADVGDARADLASRFAGPLTFGTAGLRGVVGAGETRMNEAVVVRATAGLARFLIATAGRDARVVVGCDARHGSEQFRNAALEVLAGAGLTALGLPPRLPTPITAFAVRELDADAGIMITASHNPPADNGFKVYLGARAADRHGRGVQIVPPADVEIAAQIAASLPADEIARMAERIIELDDEVAQSYVERTAALRAASTPSPVRVVLTPLHGVGGNLATDVLARAGVEHVSPVPRQFAPDPDFPTVAFPNPEEPGALDLALAQAESEAADIVIALDPDADRLSVAIPGSDGSWRALTGDEIGALLGEQAATDDAREGDVLACSVVSSRLLARIAAAHGLRSAVTLTGFKWIARVPNLRFGYEEAIGYCTDPATVADKDGISAMVRMIVLVESLAASGMTLEDRLDELARAHGLHASAQLSFRMDDVADIDAAMTRLRDNGIPMLAGSPVVQATDLIGGTPELPPTNGLIYRTAADDRIIVRPSGTEPKLKCYLEVVLPTSDTEIPHAAAHARLDDLKTGIAAALGFPRPA